MSWDTSSSSGCEQLFARVSCKCRATIPIGTDIGGYTLISLLGQGGYGDVYKVRDSSGHCFALKTESKTAGRRALVQETDILLKLNSAYFPKVHARGETDEIYYTVMDLCGCSLSEVRRNHGNVLSTKVALFLGIEMVRAIQELHNAGFIHRDIKPGNFLLKDSRDVHLVLIDFGLACPYRDLETKQLLPQVNGHYSGTRRYSSVHALQREGLGRRDDMISWLYSMVEFFSGKLPWHSAKSMSKILKAKTTIGRNRLILGKDMACPREMLTVYDQVMRLDFDQEPAYSAILNALKDSLMGRFGLGVNQFQWDAFYRVETGQAPDGDAGPVASP
jgi:serine/threonine protein kinase